MELECAIQTYDWGKHGSNSIVADLMRTANADFVLDEHKPYAELWMGIHKNGPSYLKDMKIPLQKYIQENINVLGSNIETQNFGGTDLSFLFKVLSINKALSIQVHPDKEKAEVLHNLFPNVYKDPNHKPELAIALTPFKALCGFRPINDIKKYMEELPELSAAVGEDNACLLLKASDSLITDALKKCFFTLMSRDSVILHITQLLERLEKRDDAYKKLMNFDLLQHLHTDFPGDVGCFAVYLLNYITLQPGEAIYIPPNVIHAYLSGDCIECMVCSDNVIRAGLTPKQRDLPNLMQSMTFDCVLSSIQKLLPSREDIYTEIFRPPVSEFAVAKIIIPPEQSFYKLIPRTSASILIIIDGKANISSKTYCRGSVLFIPANEEIKIEVICSHQMLMFQAFANI
ncbi:mannose-6-phosphate isomerase isoform X1 [Harpegnathos saltator]|uniref:mannose-6-phosphate isomerase isoform X1 n=1 Tax=Harpegnathos saltator TaxID=610380 RepID=UPI00058B0004|nr:mannose-6-phosphate isomerase isoform X1 [Harpegnathos saltator]